MKTISETDPTTAGYAVQWLFFALASLLPLLVAIVLLVVAPGWAGRILAAAAVALVLVVDRDRGDRPAVRAAGPQGAHTARSHVSDRRTTCMPTRS